MHKILACLTITTLFSLSVNLSPRASTAEEDPIEPNPATTVFKDSYLSQILKDHLTKKANLVDQAPFRYQLEKAIVRFGCTSKANLKFANQYFQEKVQEEYGAGFANDPSLVATFFFKGTEWIQVYQMRKTWKNNFDCFYMGLPAPIQITDQYDRVYFNSLSHIESWHGNTEIKRSKKYDQILESIPNLYQWKPKWHKKPGEYFFRTHNIYCSSSCRTHCESWSRLPKEYCKLEGWRCSRHWNVSKEEAQAQKCLKFCLEDGCAERYINVSWKATQTSAAKDARLLEYILFTHAWHAEQRHSVTEKGLSKLFSTFKALHANFPEQTASYAYFSSYPPELQKALVQRMAEAQWEDHYTDYVSRYFSENADQAKKWKLGKTDADVITFLTCQGRNVPDLLPRAYRILGDLRHRQEKIEESKKYYEWSNLPQKIKKESLLNGTGFLLDDDFLERPVCNLALLREKAREEFRGVFPQNLPPMILKGDEAYQELQSYKMRKIWMHSLGFFARAKTIDDKLITFVSQNKIDKMINYLFDNWKDVLYLEPFLSIRPQHIASCDTSLRKKKGAFPAETDSLRVKSSPLEWKEYWKTVTLVEEGLSQSPWKWKYVKSSPKAFYFLEYLLFIHSRDRTFYLTDLLEKKVMNQLSHAFSNLHEHFPEQEVSYAYFPYFSCKIQKALITRVFRDSLESITKYFDTNPEKSRRWGLGDCPTDVYLSLTEDGKDDAQSLAKKYFEIGLLRKKQGLDNEAINFFIKSHNTFPKDAHMEVPPLFHVAQLREEQGNLKLAANAYGAIARTYQPAFLKYVALMEHGNGPKIFSEKTMADLLKFQKEFLTEEGNASDKRKNALLSMVYKKGLHLEKSKIYMGAMGYFALAKENGSAEAETEFKRLSAVFSKEIPAAKKGTPKATPKLIPKAAPKRAVPKAAAKKGTPKRILLPRR